MVLNRGDQLVCKFIALDIDDVVAGAVFFDLSADGVKQMGFAKPPSSSSFLGVVNFD